MRRNTNSLPKLLAVCAFAMSLGASSHAFGESAGQYVDDATITAKVKAAMLGDSQMKATQVSVTTNQGIVNLTGAVDTREQETKAVRLANEVKGVKSVNDSMTVRGIQEE